jgi:MscS family membrane protein
MRQIFVVEEKFMFNVSEQLEFLQEDTTYQVLAVVFLTAVFHVIVKIVLSAMARSAKYTNNEYDDVIIDAITKPVLYLTWLLGLSLALEVFEGEEEMPMLDFAVIVLRVGVILLFSWAINRINAAGENKLIEETKSSNRLAADGTLSSFGKLLRIVISVTAVLIVMQSLGFSISGLLAFGGIGGLAIGFAAQDLLSNFFGGLMINLDRPFSVGDWVRSPDQNIEGTVEHIGWRVTRIRTFDKRPLYVPNSTFSSISVENPSRMSNRRIKEYIGIRYDDKRKIRTILDEIRTYLDNNEFIDTRQTTMVNFDNFGDSSLDIFLYCFTHTTVWTTFHEVKEGVLLDIMDIIHKHDADIAYPTQRLSVEMVREEA